MKVISITGGVGSGKSQVLELLENEFGALVLVADKIAHQMMEPGKEGYGQVVKALGTDFLKEDGTVSRPALAELIFKDQKALETMNSIIHPLVWKTIENQIGQAGNPLIAVEAALFDEKHNRMFDEIWYIYTTPENRIKRLMESRGYTREKSLDIMRNQPGDQDFKDHSDYMIDNNGSLSDTRRQIIEILKRTDRTCD